MKLEEIIFNLLGMNRRRRVKVTSDGWEGEILIRGSRIVHSSVNLETGERIEGMDALKFILDNQSDIRVIDFLPFSEDRETVSVSQMELLSFLSPGFSEAFSGVDRFELEEGTVPSRIYDVCKKYFDRGNIKFVITEKSEEEEVQKTFKSLISQVRGTLCESGEMVLSFSDVFFLVFFCKEKFTVVALDSVELANFKLYEPQIMGEILSVLTDSSEG